MSKDTENSRDSSNPEQEGQNKKNYANLYREARKAQEEAEREAARQVKRERTVLHFEFKDYRVIEEVFRQKGYGYRYNIRLHRLEIKTPESPDWFTPTDEWHTFFVRQMRDWYKLETASAKTPQVLGWKLPKYHEELEALGGNPENQIDPVMEYLETLIWDGKERLCTLFPALFGCEANAKSTWFARYIFGAAVARTYVPGYKFDGIPILTGRQGAGKSSFLRNCLPDHLQTKYFCESLSFGMDRNRLIELMMGRVICEVPELSGFHGKDLSDLKSFVTQTSDSYRKPYARTVSDIPRTTIIIGTADRKDGIIPSDTAGNRRWPVLDLPCNNNLSRQDRMVFLDTHRDQLWAEAKGLYFAGEELW